MTARIYVYFTCREKKWQISGYKSCNLSIDESEEESDTSDEQEEDESSSDIQYVVGDVTHPQLSHDGDAIIVHCVGKYRLL